MTQTFVIPVSNGSLTNRERLTRAANLRSEAYDRGEVISLDRALREIDREELPRLRRPYR